MKSRKVESRDGEDERTIAVLDADGMPLRIEVGIFIAQVGGPAAAPTGDAPKLSSYLDVQGRVQVEKVKPAAPETVVEDNA